MNLRYKLTYDLFVDHGGTGGLEFTSACRNANSLERINQIAEECKVSDRRNRNFVIVDTQEEIETMDWGKLIASDPALALLFTPRPIDHFPSVGQSAIYFLGKMAEDCDPALEMAGAIIVFNARRHTVRAYRLNRRNALRIAMSDLYWGAYRTGDDNHYAYCEGEPTGSLIPAGDGILYAKDSVVIWNKGIVGFMSDRGKPDKWTPIELDSYNRVYDALRANTICSDIWGCLIKFFPTSPPLKADKFKPSASQIVMLDEQLVYWRNRSALANLDSIEFEFCSFYLVAVESLILV